MYLTNILLTLLVTTICCHGQIHPNNAQDIPQDTGTNIKSKPPLTPQSSFHPYENCNDDIACITMASHDRLGLEAIRSLHRQLDDDENGAVDLSESDDFLREELKYASDYERRQKAFHYNDDTHVSVRELWEAWLRSEVHNWTVEQTSEWLAINVELPQYVPTFIQHRVTGATLPRLAVNNMHYLSNVLGIKDPIHKQKISLKAMDVVLFGPPKDGQHHWKDLILVTLLFGACIACWYTYKQHKNSRLDLARMMRDMDSLRKAELALEDLQKELERARMEQENVATEKQNLEKRLQEAGGDSNSLHASYSDLEVSQLKAEIEMLRGELQRAEGELEDRCWSAPMGLQHWLQLTHELENKQYIKKKMGAEKQLQQAREACEKLRKKRSSLVGAFVSTHGKSIDDVDRSIVEARTSLNEVTQELQERVHRWKQIELICGFSIINNSGLATLENILYNRPGANGRQSGLRGRMSASQDELDDETSSLYTPAQGHWGSGYGWREPADSSGSENGKPDDDVSENQRQAAASVQFIVGGDNEDLHASIKNRQSMPSALPPPPPRRSNSNNNLPAAGPMVRSYSQDTNIAMPGDVPLAAPKSSLSETCLDTGTTTTASSGAGGGVSTHKSPVRGSKAAAAAAATRHHQRTIKEPAPASPTLATATPVLAVDDDVCSTDSSIMDEEVKRRRRKIHFPAFSKKHRAKE